MRVRHLSFGAFSVRLEREEAERMQRVSGLKGLSMNAFIGGAISRELVKAEQQSESATELAAKEKSDDKG